MEENTSRVHKYNLFSIVYRLLLVVNWCLLFKLGLLDQQFWTQDFIVVAKLYLTFIVIGFLGHCTIGFIFESRVPKSYIHIMHSKTLILGFPLIYIVLYLMDLEATEDLWWLHVW